jgi:Flp pilus assembly protein TadG
MRPSRFLAAIAAARADESGSTLVEFAVATAILTPITVGLLDFGLAMYDWIEVNNTAQAAALYATTNAQQLYSGPSTPGAFQYSLISGAGTSAGSGSNITTNVVGVCSCLPTVPTTCPSSSQFGSSNASAPYCSASCTTPESAYVCITSSYTYTPLIPVPYITGSVTLGAKAMVKIH